MSKRGETCFELMTTTRRKRYENLCKYQGRPDITPKPIIKPEDNPSVIEFKTHISISLKPVQQFGINEVDERSAKLLEEFIAKKGYR